MRVDQSSGSSTTGSAQSSDAHATKHARKAHGAQPAGKEQATGNSKTTSGESSANAQLSDRAREMATARSTASDAPDVREDKIAEIKARIAAGKYQVDPQAVADRLVDDHVRMSGIG